MKKNRKRARRSKSPPASDNSSRSGPQTDRVRTRSRGKSVRTRRAARDWLKIHREGLAKLIAVRGKVVLFHELLQNGWDAYNTTRVDVLIPRPVHGSTEFVVSDNSPEGFHDLTHAYTMFAPSEKASDPTQGGRFNVGEKFVVVSCTKASIESTTGGVRFDATGRHAIRTKLLAGSIFRGTMPMTIAEYDEVCEAIQRVISPQDITTTFNGKELVRRTPIVTFEASLPTHVANEDGVLQKRIRKTKVEVYAAMPGMPGWLYELGLPVVETGDPYDVNVCQKVPQGFNRDNVSPAYLRELRMHTVNATHGIMAAGQFQGELAAVALAHPDTHADALKAILTAKHGPMFAIRDPSDPEANHRLVAMGYALIEGGDYNRTQWENIKRHNVALPAGKIAPTPKPYSKDGPPEKLVPKAEWTPGMHRIVEHAIMLAKEFMQVDGLAVRIVNEPRVWWYANYGSDGATAGSLALNVGRLGHRWFNEPIGVRQHALLIHEFAHHYESNHLDEKYYEACCDLGAQLAALALRRSELFAAAPTPDA